MSVTSSSSSSGSNGPRPIRSSVSSVANAFSSISLRWSRSLVAISCTSLAISARKAGAGQPRHRRRIDARQQDIAHPLLVLGAGAAVGQVDDALERLIDRDEFAPARFDNPAPETVRSHLKILHQPRRSEERPDNSPDKAAMPSVKRLRRSAASEPAPAAALNRCGWNDRNYWWNCWLTRYSSRIYP